MDFSVIIPVFEACAKLERTLESVRRQPPGLCEVIVVDGGSTDGTLELLRFWGDQVRWISEKDSGIYDAMNKGISMASGRYLYFLGAGDLLEPHVLAELAPALPKGDRAFVYGNVRLAETGLIHDGLWSKGKFTRGNISHQAIFYGRGIFDLLGNYETRYRLWADCALNMKCFGDPRIPKHYVPVIVAVYEGGGASATLRDPAFERDRPGLIRKHLGIGFYLLFQLESRLPETWKQGRHRLLQTLRAGRPSQAQ